MKKILIIIAIVLVLAGCNQVTLKDTYKPYRGMTAEELYHSAQKALKKGKYTDAVRFLEASQAIFPFGPYAEQVELDSVYAYYKKGDEDMALAAVERYLRLYPRSDNVNYVYYMKGLITYGHGMSWFQRKIGSDQAPRDLAEKNQSFKAFDQMVHYFPESKYKPDAIQKMNDIRNMMARKYIIIANYYMSKNAYVAAANRASFVVQHFVGSPEVIPALTIMVKAYRKLGLTELADSAMKTFKASYPKAPQLKELERGR